MENWGAGAPASRGVAEIWNVSATVPTFEMVSVWVAFVSPPPTPKLKETGEAAAVAFSAESTFISAARLLDARRSSGYSKSGVRLSMSSETYYGGESRPGGFEEGGGDQRDQRKTGSLGVMYPVGL